MDPAEAQGRTAAVRCRTEHDTVRLGRSLAATLGRGDALFAEGELGAGKTCLIRGVCAGLGYTGTVRSPSFAVVSRYEGRCKIYHVDLYRIPESSPELEDLSRQECFADDAVTLVEWGGKLRRWGVEPSVSAVVRVEGDDGRLVAISFESENTARRAKDAGLL